MVKPIDEILVINEYYKEYKYVSHYFLCEIIGQGEQKLTEAERARGLYPRRIDVKRFTDIVSKHQEYASTNEEKRGAYLREYTAITQYLDML